MPGNDVDVAFDKAGFDHLVQMQERHFWYLGRHRFLLCALRDQLGKLSARQHGLCGVDLGGGCGGWLKYLHRHDPGLFAELALADSSPHALQRAETVVGDFAACHRVDLLALGWKERWDVAFMLDVLEHIADDRGALLQVRESLRPGGLLFITVPALQLFWSYNDDIDHHRRYARRDFEELARETDMELCRARYFMFLLSPLLLVSRLKRPDLSRMTRQEILALLLRSHRVPFAPLNQLLRGIFSLETPLGWRFPLPWGTSILAVLRKPR